MACNIQYLNNYPNPGHPGNTLMNLTQAERHVLFTLVMKRISDNAVGEPFELPPLPTPEPNRWYWPAVYFVIIVSVAFIIVTGLHFDTKARLMDQLRQAEAELQEARKIQWVPVTPRKKEP